MEPETRLKTIQGYISKMPPLPATATKVMELCNRVSASAEDLNRVILLDPVLAGKVLRLVNSAYCGLSQEVSSLVHAIIMLGMNTVKNLVFSAAVLSSLGGRKNFQALDMTAYWQHSLAVAVTAKFLARHHRVKRELLEDHFIAGLLHDIGKIPLNDKFADQYSKAIAQATEAQGDLHRFEYQCLGIDHMTVGKQIARKWRLGSEITEAAAFHHDLGAYQGQNREILMTVAVADNFVNEQEIGFSGNPYPDKTDPALLSTLDLTPEYLKDIRQEVDSEIEQAQIFLSIAE